MRRIVTEAAQDDAREGSRRLEIQIDPTSYAPYVGGITPALEIVLDEGRNRQIRRLLAARDIAVLRLVRVAIGSLQLGQLAKGQWRELDVAEREALLHASK